MINISPTVAADDPHAAPANLSRLRVDAIQQNLICQRGVIAAERRVAL